MRGLILSLALLFVPSCCSGISFGQIKVAPEYSAGSPLVLELAYPEQKPEQSISVIWQLSGNAGQLDLPDGKLVVWPEYRGESWYLEIRAAAFLFTKNSAGEQVLVPNSHAAFRATTRILGVADNPVPPGPGPGPAPEPQPNPTPSPAPIEGAGFRVLIVYETSAVISSPQRAAITSNDVRTYLNGKCARVNNHPEWRILDPDQAMTAGAIWAKALARPMQLTKTVDGKEVAQAWVIISNGVTGFEGPVPDEPGKFLDLLKKYGG